jgi:hypothetical protein
MYLVKQEVFQLIYMSIFFLNLPYNEAKGFRKIPKKEDKHNDFWSKDYRLNNLNPVDSVSRYYSMILL